MKTVGLRVTTTAVAAVALLGVAACGSGGSGTNSGAGASGGGGKTTITLLHDNSDSTVATAKAVIDAFQKANPDITVKTESRPGGSDGDNIVKTKLSTGDMQDVFWYNSGSLMQALSPEKNLVDLTNDPVLKDTDESFLSSVTQNGKVYGAPQGTAMGGGILYNRDVYAKLGLQPPTTWAEFEANSDKIKAAGITPLVGSFGDTWTSQLFVLGDFCNVTAADPNFAKNYTENKAKYATTPAALAGFQKTAEPKAKGWLNSSAGSLKFDQGMKLLAQGRAAQYPLLTFPVGTLPAAQQAKIGFFGIPGTDASKHCATLWEPGGQYIPKSSKNIDAAKKFVAFVASPEGAKVASEAVPPTGPYLIKGYQLPESAPQVAKDLQKYISDGKTAPALEFVSPVKGPSLEQITVAVETGQTSAEEGAKQYDADVTKQAKQLDLPGW